MSEEFNANNVRACSRFEPIEAFQLNGTTKPAIETTALMSIAISLKRIADALEEDIDIPDPEKN